MSADSDCRLCKHYAPTALYQLCGHDKSTYRVDGQPQEQKHTVGHMRSRGACMSVAVFYVDRDRT